MASSSSSSSHDPFSPPPATLSSGAGDEPSSSPPRIDFQHADERDADDFIAAAGATPLRVAAVAIKGLQRTSRPIVERELSNLREARTLDEVKAVLLSDWESLQTLGIFSAVELVLDECSPVRERREKVLFFSLFPLIDGAWRSTSLLTTSTFSLEKNTKKTHRQPVPGACRVVATFAERPRLSLNTGTYVQGTEGSVELLASLLNAGGRAERITLAFEKGSRQLDEASLTVERRRPWGLPCSVDAGVHQRSRSWAPTASFDELSRSLSAGAASADGRHALAYELAWRSLADATRRASASVKAQAGNSLKSALRYTRRFGGTLGEGCREEGAAARVSLEVAGVGAALASSSGRSSGSSSSSSSSSSLVRHFRQQVSASLFSRVSENVCLELTADAGVLLPWGGGGGGAGAAGRRTTSAAATSSSSSSSSISDRFFLGGVGGGLRGFGIRACGPTDQRHGSGAIASSSPSRPASAATSPSPAGPPLSARGSDVTGAAAARAEADARATAAAAAATAAQAVDFVGADLSVSVLAALRFELPWKNLRDIGIFGHVFANGAGMSLLGGGSGGLSRTGASSPSAASSAAASPSRGATPAASLLSPSSSFPLAAAVAAAAGELCSTWRWSVVRRRFFSFFSFFLFEPTSILSSPPPHTHKKKLSTTTTNNRVPVSSGPRASATSRSTL